MLLLRKVDCYVQLALAVCTILSLPFFSGIGLLVGLLVIGCWQLTSAALNTYCFNHSGFQKRIRYYWVFTFVDLLLVVILFYSLNIASIYTVIVKLTVAALAAVIGTAIYYWIIYFRLIQFISLRNELDGLTKSKH